MEEPKSLPPAKRKRITLCQALRAAKSSHYAPVGIRAVNATALIGQYLEQDAIKTLAPALLVRTVEDLAKSIEQCDRVLSLPNDKLTSEEANSILLQKGRYISQQIEVARAIQDAAVLTGKSVSSDTIITPSFGPREQVSPAKPVQVNIGIQSGSHVTVNEKSG